MCVKSRKKKNVFKRFAHALFFFFSSQNKNNKKKNVETKSKSRSRLLLRRLFVDAHDNFILFRFFFVFNLNLKKHLKIAKMYTQ